MSFYHQRICCLPLDSRPVCFDMPALLAESAGLSWCAPSPSILGKLKTPADEKALFRWIKNHLFENAPVLVSLDTLAYGGLIPSRINEESTEVIEKRLEKFFGLIKSDFVAGFSSILRIPNYNNDEEEPTYWKQHGKHLYEYSEHSHQHGKEPTALKEKIPKPVLEDFLSRRQRHHLLNQHFLQQVVNGHLDYLTFCQDDTGTYGLNVEEAEDLHALINERGLAEKSHVQTGADEVASVMIARWLVGEHIKTADAPPKVFVTYTDSDGAGLTAKFDGLPIKTVVKQQLSACGLKAVRKKSDADFILLVHTPNEQQGDHCSGEVAKISESARQKFKTTYQKTIHDGTPLAIADVSFANGCDATLIENWFCSEQDVSFLYGFSGWNTPGNTIGSALAMATVRWVAEQHKTFQIEPFQKLLFTRLADDWLYQSEIRQDLRKIYNNGKLPNTAELTARMSDGLSLIKTRLGLDKQRVECFLPCQRFFEIGFRFL